MIRFSSRDRALRQLSALRRLSASSNPAEAESARLEADRVQRRHRFTEEDLCASNTDMDQAVTAEGWDDPWRLTLLGSLGDQAGVSVLYALPEEGSSEEGQVQIRGPCAGRILREATLLASRVQDTISDPAILAEIANTPVKVTTQVGNLNIQQASTISATLGTDISEIYAIALVFRGVARIAKKLRTDIEALERLDAKEAARAARTVQDATPPAPPHPDLMPAPEDPPEDPSEDSPEDPPEDTLEDPPNLALIAFNARLARMKHVASQLLGVPGFAVSVDRRVDPATWDTCGDRLAGADVNEAVVIRGLLIDRQHERDLARAARRDLILQICADLTIATRRPWGPIERDPDGTQTADGMQRLSIGTTCFLMDSTGLHPLGIIEGTEGWRARLVEAVRFGLYQSAR